MSRRRRRMPALTHRATPVGLAFVTEGLRVIALIVVVVAAYFALSALVAILVVLRA